MKNQDKEAGAQVPYLDRWVNRNHFRVVVYNESGQKLVNSYDEYLKAIESGLWFSEKEAIAQKPERAKPGRKPKDGADS